MATDRLRRRLRDVDADTVSSLSSNFCVIGTPLPDLDARKKDQDELKPIWQQEARDAQGRRRFHGAFTGGFSAGYFNTVGSKEGWTPGSFRSSRADKIARKQPQVGSRPEDFMDEEDLEDWKAAQHVSASSAGMEGSQNKDSMFAGLRETTADPISRTLFGDVANSTGQSLGFRLLRSMGWKEGQGLGPRIDAKKKARLLSLVSSSSDARSLATSSDVTLEDMKHLYAPPPTPVLAYTANVRGNRKGLGAEERPTLQQMLDGVRKLDETPESTVSHAPADVWPDGRPLLPGFRLASQPVPVEPTFVADTVPEGWQPDPSRVWRRYAPASTDAKPSNLSAATRGQLLGEARIPGPPPNIAAFLSAKARERLAGTSSPLPLPVASSTPVRPSYVDVPRLDHATAKEALQGSAHFGSDPARQERYLTYLRGQVDGASEEAKRLPVPESLTSNQFENELREFAKIAAMSRPMSSAIASRFTKASASVMAHEMKATTATPGLRHPTSEPAAADQGEERLGTPDAVAELSVAHKAAQMGNFGHLTRTVEPWAPERLLCKRFGVPEPFTSRKQRDSARSQSSTTRPEFEDDSDPFYGSGQPSKNKSSNVRVDQLWEDNKAHLKALAAGPTPLALDAQSSQHTLAASLGSEDGGETQETAIGMGDDDRQGRDTLTYTKPSIDVYKAIFASDEEGSESEDLTPAVRKKPKMQDPALGAGVLFQARSKRKGVDGDGDKTTLKQESAKRKKDKPSKRSLLTFEFEDDNVAEGGPSALSTPAQSKAKARTRASDLF